MLFWRTGNQQHDLLVHVTLGAQGLGPVELTRLAPGGASVPIGTPNPQMHNGGTLTFTISPAEQQAAMAGMAPPPALSLQFRLATGNPAMVPTPVFLRVEQNGAALSPQDALGNPLPVLANGVALPPPLTFNSLGLRAFQVEY